MAAKKNLELQLERALKPVEKAAERDAAHLREIAEAVDEQLPAIMETERRHAELADLMDKLIDARGRGDDAETGRLQGEIDRLRAQWKRS